MSAPTDDLQGWKEIAAYLGKSVRAAQRWEAEMGLPVHRLRTPNGQIVFAKREEIDNWRSRQEIPPDPGGVPADADDTSSATTVARSPLSRRVTAVGLAAVLVVAVVGLALRRATTSVPVDFTLEVQDIAARDAAGRVLWTYTFPHKLSLAASNHLRHLPPSHILRADVDGDGKPEVLAVTTYDYDSGSIRSDTLWCFTETGRLLWKYAPNQVLEFNGGTFSGAWEMDDIIFSSGPGPQNVWLATSVVPWWPSMIVEIDAKGRDRMVFLQSGNIYTLALSNGRTGELLWVGGINNEYASASVALIDPHVSSTSPQTPGSSFECRNCPAGRPLKYFLFPRSEVNYLARQPYNRTVGLAEEASGRLEVQTQEGEATAPSQILYELEPNGPMRATPTDTFWLAHDELRQAGAVAHDAAHCPERTAVRTVRVWTPSAGWSELRQQPHTAAEPGLSR